MDEIATTVSTLLKEKFGDEVSLDFHDERGDGRHFSLQIVSELFEGKTRVERSQIVYGVLSDLIKTNSIHALRMKCSTPNEIL